MRKPILFAISALAAFVLIGAVQFPVAARGPLPTPQTWVDDQLFNGVVTPATFDPESDPFDELYSCSGPPTPSFADGVPLISESKPGDQDYNGGRWHLNVATDTNACKVKYSSATSVEDLDLNDFMSTPNYFECPLLPTRGAGR